jgi:uncharacterized protein
VKRIRERFKSYLGRNASVNQLTIAACLGVYIAFSPFIGFHTLMTIVFSWAFALNFFVMFGITTAINNPWTMAFVYGLDYVVGVWLFKLFHLDLEAWNPLWLDQFNEHVQTYTGWSGISLGAFLLGGNVLGVLAAMLFYPVLYRLFKRWTAEIPPV